MTTIPTGGFRAQPRGIHLDDGSPRRELVVTGPAVRRVVVLGGTGFVGSHVCSAFAARGCEVLAVARKPPPVPFSGFLSMDIHDTPADVLAATLKTTRADVVVDATGSSWGLSEEDMGSRCTALTERLRAALTAMSGTPRLVHLGSVLEYGPIPPGESADRTAPQHPPTAYGKAKLAATRCVLAATARGDVDGVVLRIANAVGPGLHPTSLLGKVARGIRAGEVVELLPLRAQRDYVDVRDVADAVVAAADSDVAGEVIDIGRGEAVPVRSLVDLLIEVSGLPARVVERAEDDGGWRAQTGWSRVDIDRARDLLDWKPRRSLADAVRAYWESLD